jgi:hypothetical protein
MHLDSVFSVHQALVQSSGHCADLVASERHSSAG